MFELLLASDALPFGVYARDSLNVNSILPSEIPLVSSRISFLRIPFSAIQLLRVVQQIPRDSIQVLRLFQVIYAVLHEAADILTRIPRAVSC